MTPSNILLVVLLMSALSFSGCGDKPEALITSAKEYIAKQEYSAAAIQLKNALQKNANLAEARYLLGLSLLESGDSTSAEKELRKAVELNYPQETAVPLLARALLEQGRLQELISEFGNKSLSDSKAQADLKANIGYALLGLGKKQEADVSFQDALQAQPNHSRAKLGQARLLAVERDTEGAISIVDEVLQKSPDSLEALFLKAELFKVKNDLGASQQVFQKIVELKPENVAARYALTMLFVNQRDFDAAASQLDAMKKIAPKDPRTLYLDALLLVKQEKLSEARDALLQVLKIVPDHTPSLLLAGTVEFQSGAYAQAEGYLTRVLASQPNHIFARRVLASTFLRSGQAERALEILQPLLEETEDAELLMLAGQAYLANNEIEKASEFYEKAAASDPQNATARTRLGQLRFAAGDEDQAVQDLEAAAAIDPNQTQADLALVVGFLRRNQPDKALQAVQALDKKQPNSALTHNLKGIVYLAKQDRANARASFERALVVQPTFTPALFNLARLEIREKRPDAARKHFDAALQKDPRNEPILLGLADILTATGADRKEINAVLEKAINANPSSMRARMALINSHLQAQDVKKAQSLAQETQAAFPDNPQAVEILGVTQLAAGDTNQAIATFGKLVGLMPRSPGPLLRLAGAYVTGKDNDKAIAALRKALALKPDLLEARRQITVVYLASNRPDDALAEARMLQKERPKDPVGYALEGDILTTQKKWGDAQKAYRTAIDRSSSPMLIPRLHTALLAENKNNEAESLASKWIKDHPNDTVMPIYLAERAMRVKDYKSAAKYYRDALAVQPNNAIILNNLAWVAAQNKDPTALSYAERAFTAAPESPAVLDTLGMLLVEKGEVGRGLDFLTKASKLAPDAADIRLNLAKAMVRSGQKDSARKELEVLRKLGDKFPAQSEVEGLLKTL